MSTAGLGDGTHRGEGHLQGGSCGMLPHGQAKGFDELMTEVVAPKTIS